MDFEVFRFSPIYIVVRTITLLSDNISHCFYFRVCVCVCFLGSGNTVIAWKKYRVRNTAVSLSIMFRKIKQSISQWRLPVFLCRSVCLQMKTLITNVEQMKILIICNVWRVSPIFDFRFFVRFCWLRMTNRMYPLNLFFVHWVVQLKSH